MEIFLTILMVLGIFIAIPAIIGFVYVGVASGLFRVISHRARRRITASRRRVVRIPEETVSGKAT